ncbi:hypothetical protein ACIPSJ_27020 [Streptomyces sp. NPDC090088]|uniref:hypothetical protein n=1 Tax=Streptomyces sp. NPDC090088 TaxID=3365944 RepID=UPI00381A1919
MNTHPDRAFREDGGGSDPEHLLDQLLAHHRTQLTSAVTEALDTGTGSNALVPLRRELFHGLGPFKLAAPLGRTAADGTPESAAPSPSARLQEILTRLRDIRLMVDRVRASADLPSDVHTRTQTAATVLQCLHTGLQARTLARDQVHSLFQGLEAHTAYISTAMLGLRTPLSRHAVEEWLRTIGALRGVERMAMRFFRDADDNVPTQG